MKVRNLALASLALLAVFGTQALAQSPDLSALPEGKLNDVCVPEQDYAFKVIRERDAEFGAALEKTMTTTESLRDRVDYLLRSVSSRDAQIDETEHAYTKGTATEEDLQGHVVIKKFLITMSVNCGWTYQEFLKQNYETDQFVLHRDAFIAVFNGFVADLTETRKARRAELGLPEEQPKVKAEEG